MRQRVAWNCRCERLRHTGAGGSRTGSRQPPCPPAPCSHDVRHPALLTSARQGDHGRRRWSRAVRAGPGGCHTCQVAITRSLVVVRRSSNEDRPRSLKSRRVTTRSPAATRKAASPAPRLPVPSSAQHRLPGSWSRSLPTKTTVWSASARVESPRGRSVTSHAAYAADEPLSRPTGRRVENHGSDTSQGPAGTRRPSVPGRTGRFGVHQESGVVRPVGVRVLRWADRPALVRP